MDTVIHFIMVPMVYIAFGVFFIGTAVRLIRIFRAPKHPSTLQIYPLKKPAWLFAVADTFLFPTVRRHKPLLWVFLIVFHVCLLLLIIGHLELFDEIAPPGDPPRGVPGTGYVGLFILRCSISFSGGFALRCGSCRCRKTTTFSSCSF